MGNTWIAIRSGGTPDLIGINNHGAKLEDFKELAMESHPLTAIKDRPAILSVYAPGSPQKYWTQKDQSN
jgi:hypothetical protein